MNIGMAVLISQAAVAIRRDPIPAKLSNNLELLVVNYSENVPETDECIELFHGLVTLRKRFHDEMYNGL